MNKAVCETISLWQQTRVSIQLFYVRSAENPADTMSRERDEELAREMVESSFFSGLGTLPEWVVRKRPMFEGSNLPIYLWRGGTELEESPQTMFI